ncbi:MAG: MFS transporter [Fuerstia sp.]|nr:MFS transporter [Fuerstiella sp.]
MDQQLFNLARVPAMKELLPHAVGQPPEKDLVTFYGALATSVFMIGWATGGLVFGVLGDRIGRAKVMMWTILIYSVCTGLSAFSVGFWDFAFYRFLTGLGVGGEFAVGVSLVAEVMPSRARPFALGLLQALSAVGNVTAALMNITLGQVESSGGLESLVVADTPVKAWRILFIIGTLPAILTIFIRRNLKEPETWKAQADAGLGKQLGSFSELFSDPVLRRNAIVGLIMASSGIIGLWGIGFFSFDLLSPVFVKHFEAQGLAENVVSGKVATWVGITSVMQNIGGFLGIYAYSHLTSIFGRKPAFAVSFVAAMLSTALVFWTLDQFHEIFWMIPLMGFCQLALFGGYAIYFPELFPTRLRSTGISFCYNVGRYVAAAGPFALGLLTSKVFTVANGYQAGMGMRYAGVAMCSVFLIGLMALPFAPETKGKPLPE